MVSKVLQMDQVTEVIGFTGALIMAALYGNNSISIPKGHMASSHPLVVALGRENAESLSEAFGGIILNIPSCAIFGKYRSVAIAYRLYKDGNKVEEIAYLMDIPVRTITKYISEAKQLKPRYIMRGNTFSEFKRVIGKRDANIKHNANFGLSASKTKKKRQSKAKRKAEVSKDKVGTVKPNLALAVAVAVAPAPKEDGEASLFLSAQKQ